MTTQQALLNQALVIRTTRRWVVLLDEKGEQLQARSSTKAIEATVGDQVTYLKTDADVVIQEILPRQNVLERKNLARSKVFATNVDRLYVVTSVGTLFNTAFIDRAITAAFDQEIPVTMILNKIDSADPLPDEIETYRGIGIEILRTSVKSGEGIEELKNALEQTAGRIVVFCGLSGVGKSSLLNILVPGSARDTGSVSHRTGQGKQTTTQAEAFPFKRAGAEELHIVDLPGFSQFGMIHIPLDRLTLAYPEFAAPARECAFSNCSHIEEPVCGVKSQLEAGIIKPFRYQSYLEIRNEIKCAPSY